MYSIHLFIELLLMLFALSHSATVISKNPSFEQGGTSWNFRFPTGVTPAPFRFIRNAAQARTGQRLLALDLQAGAVFPTNVRVGQSVTMRKRYLHRVVIFVRVNSGTAINGNRGAIVSTFCESRSSGLFVGKDSTVNETPGFRKGDYTKIVFDVVGNGGVWDCTVALLGQPSAQPLPISLSVDDFRIFEIKALPAPNIPNQNQLVDSGFSSQLAPLNYQNGQLVIPGNGWQQDYFFGLADPPTIRKQGSKSELVLQLPPKNQRSILEFTGVVQKVQLRQGQQYELAVNYNREVPANKPPGVAVTIFNYYLRVPVNPTGQIRQTEGHLTGLVDVRIGNTASGVSKIRFYAHRNGQFIVVLKVSAYGNEGITSAYRMVLDNAKLSSISG